MPLSEGARPAAWCARGPRSSVRLGPAHVKASRNALPALSAGPRDADGLAGPRVAARTRCTSTHLERGESGNSHRVSVGQACRRLGYPQPCHSPAAPTVFPQILWPHGARTIPMRSDDSTSPFSCRVSGRVLRALHSTMPRALNERYLEVLKL